MIKDKELKIHLDSKPPKSIKFSDVTPISKHSVKEMLTKDFITLAQSQGNSIQSWSEITQYGGDEKLIMTRLQDEGVKVLQKSNSVLKFLLGRMQNNSSKLVICNMGQKLGYGVVTLDVIAKGDPVAIYTGRVKMDSFKSNYAYTFNHDDSTPIYCDPEKDGNISRFFQHAFTEANAAKFFKKYGGVDGPVATANVEVNRIVFDGKIYLMFFATRQIEKNQMIFCDYEPNYWTGKRNLRPQSFNEFGLSLEVKNPQYILRILGSKIVEKGMSLLSETKKITAMVPLEVIQELKEITVESPINPDLKFTIPTSRLRESLISNSNHLTLYVCDPAPFKYHPRYQEYILAVLKHQTGIEWQYNAKNVAVYREFNKTVFSYLKSHGFKIQAGTASSGVLMGKKTMIFQLAQEVDQDKLAELNPINQTPDPKPESTLTFTPGARGV